MEMDTTTTPSPTLMPQDPDEIYRISHLPRNDTDDRPKYFVLGDNEEIFFKLVELMIFVNVGSNELNSIM